MSSFFGESFQEQVKSIIGTGDLKLLQAFIGIRNPIALLQYNSSFICTKINLMATRLHGEYKVEEKCLLEYKDNVIAKDYDKAVCSSGNADLYSALISDASEGIQKDLLTNILLPINNKESKVYDSICNSDYMHPSKADWELIKYVRNTEINSLSCMNVEQVKELYNSFLRKSISFVQNVIESHPLGSSNQRNEINLQLQDLGTKIHRQEHEIKKYKDSLNKIKDRTFLTDWFDELLKTVKNDAKVKGHLLNNYFVKDTDREDIVITEFKMQYPKKIVKLLLNKIVGYNCNPKHLTVLNEIIMKELSVNEKLDYQYVVQEVTIKLKKKVTDHEFQEVLNLIIDGITANSIMEVEQCVLDDILKEAIKQEKVDSALLLICNGANVNLLKRMGCKATVKVREKLDKMLAKPGFLVIEELYSSMPSIKVSLNKYTNTFNDFCVSMAFPSTSSDKEFNIKQIFGLEEIRSSFPEEAAIRMIAENIANSRKDKLIHMNEIERREQLLRKLDQEKLLSKVGDYLKSPWQRILTVLLLGVPFFSSLIYEAGRSWNARRNARNELEIAQEDLKRVTKLFDIFLEHLQITIVAGSDMYKEKYNHMQEEINLIKKNKEKWVNLSNVLAAFESIEEASSKNMPVFITKSIKFSELAENMISNRMRYMDELNQSSQPSNEPFLFMAAEDHITEILKKKSEADEERNARGQAEFKNKYYLDILLKVQNGDLPVSALQNLKLE